MGYLVFFGSCLILILMCPTRIMGGISSLMAKSSIDHSSVSMRGRTLGMGLGPDMISKGKRCRLIWFRFRKQTENRESLILGVAIAEKEKASVPCSCCRYNRGIRSLLVWVLEVDQRNYKKRPRDLCCRLVVSAAQMLSLVFPVTELESERGRTLLGLGFTLSLGRVRLTRSTQEAQNQRKMACR